MFILYLCA